MRALFPGAAQWLLMIWMICFIHDVTARPSTSQPTQSTTLTLSTSSIALEENVTRYTHKKINTKYKDVNGTFQFNKRKESEVENIYNNYLKNLKGKRNIFRDVPYMNVINQTQFYIDLFSYDKNNFTQVLGEDLNSKNVSFNMIDKFVLRNTSFEHNKNKTVRIESVLPVELAGYNEENSVNAMGVEIRRHVNNNNASLRNPLDDPPEKKVIKHRVKRNRMEQVDKPIFSPQFPDSNRDARTSGQQRFMDIRDTQLFNDFVQQSIKNLKANTENTQNKADHNKTNLFPGERKHDQFTQGGEGTRATKYSFLKRWPDSPITTAEELENYQNYTSLNFDETNLSPDVITFNNWDKNSNTQEDSFLNKKKNQSLYNYAVSTSAKKPVIHQVLTEWSDTPNFDVLKKPWEIISSGDQSVNEPIINKLTPDDESISNGQISYNEYSPSTESTFDVADSSDVVNINYFATKKTPSFDDGPVVYIRPKPSYLNHPPKINHNGGGYVSSTGKPTTPPQDIFKRPLRNKNKNKNKHKTPTSTLSSLIYTPNSGLHSSVPLKIVTPSYSSDDGSEPSYRPTSNVNDADKPDPDEIHFPDKDYGSDPATHIIVQDDCPTVFVTINNTVQNEAKEGCADIHLIINSNVLQNNVLVEDPISIASDAPFDPVSEDQNSYPILPVAPVVAADVPIVEGTNSLVPIVPLAVSPVGGNVIPGGIQSPLASPGISSVSTNSAGLNPVSLPSLNPPPGIGSLSNFASGGDSSDDEDDSIGSWIHSATGVFAWMTFLNPLNYGIFSLFLAPLVILVAGGAGLAALMTPWVWPSESSKSKKVVFIEEPTRWYWAWDPTYKTWNWAPYPSYSRDWGASDSNIVESSIVKLANSNDDEIEYSIDAMVSNVGGNVRKWAYDLYENIVGDRRISRRKKRSNNLIEDWKKRRK